MRTTINERVGRRGGACSNDDLQEVLANTRKLLANASALLELEIDRLFEKEFAETDEQREKDLRKTITEVQKTWSMVMDLQAKALKTGAVAAPLDLEEAKDEIMRRLDRLAAA